MGRRTKITILTDGTYYKVGRKVYQPTCNKARALAAMCKLAGIGEYQAASYAYLVDYIWLDSWDGSRYGSMKANLHALINMLRNEGLQEAIRTKSGVGYYWCPESNINFITASVSNTPSTAERRRNEVEERKIKETLQRKLKKVSFTLAGAMPLRNGRQMAFELVDVGFRQADIARMFGVSRAAVNGWLK